MEKSARSQYSISLQNENSTKTTSCPMCFHFFSPLNIQSHAATCNGHLMASKDQEKDQNGMSENLVSDKKAISSFFKPQLQNKRLQSENPIQDDIPIKKIKVEESSARNSFLNKKDSNSVRRPLADVMRPTSLEQYKGQENVVGEKNSGFLMPLLQSFSKPGADLAAIPSMLFWVSSVF